MNTHLNEAATEAWEVALGLLKPSARDLECGLELHRRCLVAESYSLGLHAPVELESARAELEAGASAAEVKEGMEAQLMLNWATTPALRAAYQQALDAAGVSCLFLNAGEEGNDPLTLLKRLARYTHLMDAMPEVLGRATSVEQIKANHRAGKHSLCLTLNGVPLAGRLQSVEDELSYIKVFAQLGVRMMHLTYNRRNLIGDGCGEKNDGGLSDFGHAVVKEMNRAGILIDLAHTGWRTCLDAASASSQPVVVSHSTAHALHASIRAKPDDVIKAVVDTGGLMGITNVPGFLGGSGDICALLRHIDYVVQKFGEEFVTIGTDCPYRLPSPPASEPLPDGSLRSRTRWEALWPAGGHPITEEWSQPAMVKSLSWTNWPLFIVGMVQMGYSEERIRGIVGGNLLRVAGQVWK